MEPVQPPSSQRGYQCRQPKRSINHLPDEVLSIIMAHHLLINKVLIAERNTPQQKAISEEARHLGDLGWNGSTGGAIEWTRWSTYGVRQKHGLLAEIRYAVGPLNPVPLAVSRQWNKVGSALLLRRNNFVGVQKNDPYFQGEAETFDIRLWPLALQSSPPDLVIKIIIEDQDENQQENASVHPQKLIRLVFDLAEYNELVRFLMLKTSGAEWRHSGSVLRVNVRKSHVPHFCHRGNAFEKLVLPLLHIVWLHIRQVLVSPSQTSTEQPVTVVDIKTTQAHIRSEFMILKSHPNQQSRNLLLPSFTVQRFIINYQLAAQEGAHELAGQTLEQILEYAASTYRKWVSTYDDPLRRLHLKTTGAWFVTEVLRIAAYEMAAWQLVSTGQMSGSERMYWILRALQCVGYAVAFRLAESKHNASWKVRCYSMMFHLYAFLGDVENLFLSVQRCAILARMRLTYTIEDLESAKSKRVGETLRHLALNSKSTSRLIQRDEGSGIVARTFACDGRRSSA